MEETFRRIATSQTTDALWVCVRDLFWSFGVMRISYHHYPGAVPQSGAERGVTVTAEGFPEEWVCEYIQERLYTVDPIMEFARTVHTPFLWEDIEQLMRVTPAQKDYLMRMRKAGVLTGLAFQVYGPMMRNGYVGLGFDGPVPPLSSQDVLIMQCVAQAGHLRYCDLTQDEAQNTPSLSVREREVLKWIAQGKSNGVISDILGVSPHTVDTMVRRLYAKLNVADRTTAAIRGIGAGLILPSQ